MDDRSDRELVDGARGGDRSGFSELVRRYRRRIHRLALHMLRDAGEAEDVTQETFVRAYAALGRFDGRSEPFTWIYRIAVNLSLNVLRARRPGRRADPLDDPRLAGLLVEQAPDRSDPGEAVQRRALAVALAAALDELSETLRTTLVLVTLDGLGHADAAKVLGCPEGTVAWRVHEARKKLRAALAARGFEEATR